MRPPVLPAIIPPRRRRSFGGLTVSVLLHALLIILVISPWFRKYHLFSAEGSDLPGTGGGGGRTGQQYIALAALRPEAAPPKAVHLETPVVPPPVVIPTVIPPPTPAPDTVVRSQPQTSPSDSGGGATSGAAGTGGGTGGGNGGGQGPGTGGGVGPGTGGSERGRSPVIRSWGAPPMNGTPKPLRGKDISITCYVGADGRLERYELAITIDDGRFRQALDEVIRAFRFTPARDSLDRPVRGVSQVYYTLGNR